MLANTVRTLFKGKLVGLTGSAGKTTTKEMLAAVLSVAGKVLATKGNLNNEIGVPLTLLQLQADHDFAVIEMGASRPGDIRYLVNIAEPNVAILLNAKPVHVEGFGSVEGVAATKEEIFEGLSSQSVAVVNLDDAFAQQWLTRAASAQVITTSVNGVAGAIVSAEDIVLFSGHVDFTLCVNGERTAISLPVPGRHNVGNALAAVAAAYGLGLSVDDIAVGLNAFSGVNGRLKSAAGLNGSVIIDDSYNANPEAMKAAIDVLSAHQGNHILVMGDMGELGADARQYHFEVGEYAKNNKVGRLYAVGELSRNAVAGFGADGVWCADKQDLVTQLQQSLAKNDVVLVKGSRSAGMEDVVMQVIDSSINDSVRC